jgi:predicted Zn-dependent peptidase
MRVVERATSQAYVCLGLAGLPRDHADQWALDLLNTVLGDGTSSRLFLKVREQDGLAYDVHSFQTDYADCGTLQVFMAVDAEDAPSATECVLAELARLRDERVPPAELERARSFALGRLELRLEESRAMASFLGTQEALHDRVMTMDEVMEALRAVTSDDLQALAGRLFRDDALCAAAIGPGLGSRGLEAGLRLP